MTAALRDGNRVTVALGQSSTDSTTTLPFLIDPVTGRVLVDSGGASSTVYSEVLTDSGDHRNFTSSHTINSIYSLQDGSGKGVPLKDGSGTTNYTFSGTTLTLVSADANLATLGINMIYA